jgi:hypothetical protein
VRRRPLLVLVIAAALVSIAVPAVLAAKSLISASPVPRRNEAAGKRLQAATAAVNEEHRRIQDAAAALAHQESAARNVAGDYLVSFTTAVPAIDVLEAAAKEQVAIQVVYIWLQAPGSAFPITGRFHPGDYGWPAKPTAQVVDRIDEAIDRNLQDERAQVMAALPDAEDDTSRANLQAQLGELDRMRQDLGTTGASLYGITCSCSPTSLLSLSADVPGLGLRGIEPPDSHQDPIWPEDLLADRVVGTGGTYGR